MKSLAECDQGSVVMLAPIQVTFYRGHSSCGSSVGVFPFLVLIHEKIITPLPNTGHVTDVNSQSVTNCLKFRHNITEFSSSMFL